MAVCSAFIIFFLDVSEFFDPLSLKAYDRLFYLRSKMGLEHNKMPLLKSSKLMTTHLISVIVRISPVAVKQMVKTL